MTAPIFTFETTEDGSPTLRIGSPTEPSLSEAMHSLKGAFSETVYIYGSAIQLGLERQFTPRVLSLGLGLGYVEILACGLALRTSKNLSEEAASHLLARFGGESFEIIPELRNWFHQWALRKTDVPPAFAATYDSILERTAQHSGVDPQEIRDLLAKLLLSGRWLLREALAPTTEFSASFGCICFDAFSSKTSPELWTEPFLMEFFAKTTAPQAVLSTYACTGALKRALRNSGFTLNIREGFSSKRDSTFAVRE